MRRTMSYEEILYDVADRVATLTLNRPAKLNAWTMRMEGEVQDALLRADQDEDVRVIVLTGAGRGFCAGADMASLGGLAQAGLSPEQIEQRLRDHFRGVERPGARPDFQR